MHVIKAEVSRRAPREYVLTVAKREIGALRAGALLFHGYESPHVAREAATRAGEILAAWYRERWHSTEPAPLAAPVEPANAIHAGDVVVGRLLEAAEGDATGTAGTAGTHGFELRIPDHLWVATGLGLAQRIWTALTEEVAAA